MAPKNQRPSANSQFIERERLLRNIAQQIHSSVNLPEILNTRVQAPSLPEFLEAFTMMGLGTLTLTEESPNYWQFTGDKLVEVNKGSDCPTCNYARGYLCGAVAYQNSVKVAAVEMACQSMGDHQCKFVVQVIGR